MARIAKIKSGKTMTKVIRDALIMALLIAAGITWWWVMRP
jgi:hypothetical protein